ncbi:MAG TPA: hypothetical protein VMF63_06265 [Opitutaceae bacterium]|nr:hypothetical protein [Opitutaceae bacterium]
MHTNLSLSETLCRPHPRPREGRAGAPPARPGWWPRLRAAWRAHRAAMAAAVRAEALPDPDLRTGAAPEAPRWAPFSPRF